MYLTFFFRGGGVCIDPTFVLSFFWNKNYSNLICIYLDHGKGRRNIAENSTTIHPLLLAAIGEYYSCVLHRRCILGCTCCVRVLW